MCRFGKIDTIEDPKKKSFNNALSAMLYCQQIFQFTKLAVFKQFLKYTKLTVPDPSTSRKTYVETTYKQKLQMHNTVEYVRGCFPEVNKLIFAVEKITQTNPVFREMLPNTSLPIEPFATRWITWLEVKQYMVEHFFKIQVILPHFGDSNQAISSGSFLLKDSTFIMDVWLVTILFQWNLKL